MEFKDKLKLLRKKSKLTQSELGSILSTTGSAITHWEKGRNMPNSETLERMSVFFKVSLEELLGVDYILETNKNKVIDLDGLNDEQVNAISLIVAGLKGKKNG